ncbi:GspH/FimT family pseudopilin [Thalassotalea sp. ND16A]|uniref:GspH/FimT family pseudopilin n=1 Tax=Thalassotalea sp. ND16A TaxID=1535422 RepID=UPI00051D07D0|nr:GspH/FimT family pseudopilin [Thalassotalea sp. ND16A]KGJ88150.1 hypothetical protein ND16A_2703 [Thalassotalea sp. ND16A]
MPKSLPHIEGFSLIEVLITIAIAGILSSVALPAMFDMIKSSQMSTQANDIHRAFVIARSEAIKRGVAVTVCTINTAQDNCSNKSGWENGWIIREVDTVAGVDPIISIHYALPDNYTIHGTTDDFESNVVFTASGNTKSSGELVVCYNNSVDSHSRTIAIGRFGKVSVKGSDRKIPSGCF